MTTDVYERLLDQETLKHRVKEPVEFVRYRHPNLVYRCTFDGFQFVIPNKDTGHGGDGANPDFMNRMKGITCMKWIKAQMMEAFDGE